ncbi:hypothetical protein JEQ21_06405 [Streptococcus sp. 121]|uniref:AbiH family protein n=1 Tax=Streptococcus sp. 121 TaxID=2797637 RepID=UPI0018F0B782|nr:AbiH family protein [Streptococcus sp. 121]MBJ6746087.1 hypothetical protein [Streptococcus sp. 121]
MNNTLRIVYLIGNGFDIQVFNYLNKPVNTSYRDFFNFINWKYSKEIESNIIVRRMSEKRNNGVKGWSDFESVLGLMLKEEFEMAGPGINVAHYNEALSRLQFYFSDFLNTIVSTDILEAVNDLSKEVDHNLSNGFRESLPLSTLGYFLQDLTPEERESMKCREKINHHIEIDYTFLNFNYTALFDNYITLDKFNFDPRVYINSENNFHFQKPRRENRKDPVFTKIKTRIFHPHGFQHTPRSMLFGFDNIQQVDESITEVTYGSKAVPDFAKPFLKPYWAENEKYYENYLSAADLFVVFGHSIGETDAYWWKRIMKNLNEEKSELIIYNYAINDTQSEKEQVRDKFLRNTNVEPSQVGDSVKERIFVVNINDERERFAFQIDKEKLKKL